MKHPRIALLIAVYVLLLSVMTATACTSNQNADNSKSLDAVSDSAQIDRVVIRDIVPQLQLAPPKWHEIYQQARQNAPQQPQVEEIDYTAEWEYYEPYSGSYSPVYSGNANGLNSFDGVYSYGGHLETYYASYADYDNQLWVDDEGFFRNSDGRYVVSTNDYAEGSVIEISKGEAVVMDCGTSPGVVDVHTTWGR